MKTYTDYRIKFFLDKLKPKKVKTVLNINNFEYAKKLYSFKIINENNNKIKSIKYKENTYTIVVSDKIYSKQLSQERNKIIKFLKEDDLFKDNHQIIINIICQETHSLK
jgi:hypothetical protein